MTAFITFVACCAILWSGLSLYLGGKYFENMYKDLGIGQAGYFAQQEYNQAYGKHLRTHIGILTVSLGWLVFGTDWFFNDAEAQEPVTLEVAQPPRETLPQKCSVYLYERTEDEWDEERQVYWPPNYEWENCMGVGRK